MKITVMQNGPIVFETVQESKMKRDGKEEAINQKMVALCRCGSSGNKPFCDGTHKKVSFQGEAVELVIE